MTIVRHYLMRAAEGCHAELETTLYELAAAMLKIEGCEGLEVLRDMGDERRFVFLERWTAVEAHKQVKNALPPGLYEKLIGALEEPPQGSYMDVLRTV
jgi:quinol monooxygenase YgiN